MPQMQPRDLTHSSRMQVALEVPKQTCVAADKIRSWALAHRSDRLSLQDAAEERLEVSLCGWQPVEPKATEAPQMCVTHLVKGPFLVSCDVCKALLWSCSAVLRGLCSAAAARLRSIPRLSQQRVSLGLGCVTSGLVFELDMAYDLA
jgi:hypothetical protein